MLDKVKRYVVLYTSCRREGTEAKPESLEKAD